MRVLPAATRDTVPIDTPARAATSRIVDLPDEEVPDMGSRLAHMRGRKPRGRLHDSMSPASGREHEMLRLLSPDAA